MTLQPSIPTVLTCKGRELDPFNLKAEDIDIEEIAHSLSMQCRYNGATPEFYSVAQHSVYCALYTLNRGSHRADALGMLLHDAAEAYIGDYVRPMKNMFIKTLSSVSRLGYNIKGSTSAMGERIIAERDTMLKNAHNLLRVEFNIENAVNSKYGATRPKDWNDIDNSMAATEMLSFFGIELPNVPVIDELLPIQDIDCWSPMHAKERFLHLFNELTRSA